MTQRRVPGRSLANLTSWLSSKRTNAIYVIRRTDGMMGLAKFSAGQPGCVATTRSPRASTPTSGAPTMI